MCAVVVVVVVVVVVIVVVSVHFAVRLSAPLHRWNTIIKRSNFISNNCYLARKKNINLEYKLQETPHNPD